MRQSCRSYAKGTRLDRSIEHFVNKCYHIFVPICNTLKGENNQNNN